MKKQYTPPISKMEALWGQLSLTPSRNPFKIKKIATEGITFNAMDDYDLVDQHAAAHRLRK